MEKGFDSSDLDSDGEVEVFEVDTDFDERSTSPSPPSQSRPAEELAIFRTMKNGNEDSNHCGAASHGSGPGTRTGQKSGASSTSTATYLASLAQVEMQMISDGEKSSQDDLYSRVKRIKRNGVKRIDYGDGNYFNSIINDSDEERNQNKNQKRFKNTGKRYLDVDSPRPGTSDNDNTNASSGSNDVPEKYKRKLTLLETLFSSLIGQDEAINAFNSAIIRKQNGWVDEEHPMVFLFLGSSGIGKTELAKLTANYLCKNKEVGAFIRFDMSEYQEKHSVAKFIGSPPGYVGYEDGGQLTNSLKKHPQAMVLLDEVDKAHPEVLTILLQLFDEGRLTDGLGRTIIVKNSIFVMTSNLGSKEIANHILGLRKASEKAAKERLEEKVDDDDYIDDDVEEKIKISSRFKKEIIRNILKTHFKRDDFIGRINEIIYFHPFSSSEIDKLIAKELKFWADKAKRRHDIELMWDNSVYKALNQGYDIYYGARSIKHHIEKEVVSQIAKADERGLLKRSSKLRIKAQKVSNNGIEVEYKIMLQIKLQGEGEFQLIDLENPHFN